jgi:hypothetical protein
MQRQRLNETITEQNGNKHHQIWPHAAKKNENLFLVTGTC